MMENEYNIDIDYGCVCPLDTND